MTTCPNCKLEQKHWASTKGFSIGSKSYCCMGCGFAGCICEPPAKVRKKLALPLHR